MKVLIRWTEGILRCISENYNGGPVGIETLSAALLEQRDIIEDVIEPYLMQRDWFRGLQGEEFYQKKVLII